ncbi:restriction endonuclease subunit S [Microcystis sp. M061S2]|uniref:restriction endonuclease subunit S n=1 Tax=Microcystis sp. M061S2 TaxID=2771171 RepID=UPI0025901800|nr:restriction endonuclease subunit S [Microcystis sp. M061S2]MCA2654439.1 restriction endonuclease subunit S [Microcystis sp. M061S2]
MKELKFYLLGELGEITSSKRIFQSEYVDDGIPFYRTKEIKELANKEPISNELFISRERYEEIKVKFGVPEVGDILITAIGTVGEIYIVENEKEFYFKDGNILWLKGFKDVDPFFLRYLLSSLINELQNLSSGSAYKALPITKLKEYKIPLPPLEEQRRIAAILDKADGVRRKRKEAIRLTEELLRSTFLEMFGDPENSVYPVKTLNDVCSKITDGAHFTPTYTSTGVPFLRVTDIQNDFIDWENVKHIPIEEHKELIKRCHPKRGDILYSKNGTIGIPKIIDWDNDFSIFVSLALLSPKKEIILSDFLESFLRTPFALRQALSHTKTGTVSNLHLVEIRKVKLPVPDIHIQEQWILYKSEIHKMRNQLSGAFDESENLFNSLLQRAFRGEL